MAVKLAYRKLYKRCLIALTGITIMISSMQGMVLCKTEDGRVAVKFLSSVCCDNLDTSAASEESTTSLKEVFSSSKDNCDLCVDTPISVHLAGVSKKANLEIQVSPTITPATVTSCDFSKYQSGPELFAALNPGLASLRTIILLT